MRTADDLDFRVGSDAGQRAARARGGAEGIDLPVGIAPDLRARGIDMRLAIGGVVELIGPNGAGQLLRQPTGHLLVLVGIAVRHRRHLAQLRAQGLDDLVFLGA
jgi:hypothetical protein